MRTGERGFVRVRVRFLRQLRQAEIQNLDAPVFGDENILRLQVAVDDSLFMRRRQPVRYLYSILDRLTLGHGPAIQRRAQALALQKFGDKKRRAVALALVVGANVKHRENIRMVQRGYCPRLLLETAQAVGVEGKRLRKNL